MNFTHSEERRMLGDLTTRYIAERYSMENRHRIAASDGGFSAEHWSRFAELGVIGALFFEDHMGFGGSGFDLSVVFESLGGGLVLEPFLASAVLAGGSIAHAAPSSHIDILASLASGEQIATLAHEERESRYDLQRVATLARAAGGGYVLSGRKAVVPFGAEAQLLVVSARTSGEVGDAHGISLFLVPRGTSGVNVRGYRTIDGGRAADIELNEASVPFSALLGTEGNGLPSLEYAVGRGILCLCAEAVGAMDAAKKATIEYLQTRKQFGKAIGTFQALQHRMAHMLLEIEQARSSVTNAAAVLDADRVTRERALSAAKYTIGRVGTLVAEECIQLHGGIGMTWELPLAHYAKRLVMIDHQLGDEDHHLARFVELAAKDAS